MAPFAGGVTCANREVALEAQHGPLNIDIARGFAGPLRKDAQGRFAWPLCSEDMPSFLAWPLHKDGAHERYAWASRKDDTEKVRMGLCARMPRSEIAVPLRKDASQRRFGCLGDTPSRLSWPLRTDGTQGRSAWPCIASTTPTHRELWLARYREDFYGPCVRMTLTNRAGGAVVGSSLENL